MLNNSAYIKPTRSSSTSRKPANKNLDKTLRSLDDQDFQNLLVLAANTQFNTESPYRVFTGTRGRGSEQQKQGKVADVFQALCTEVKQSNGQDQLSPSLSSSSSSPQSVMRQPVNLGADSMTFMDGSDVEMTDLSGPQPNRPTYKQGNSESFVCELDDCEAGGVKGDVMGQRIMHMLSNPSPNYHNPANEKMLALRNPNNNTKLLTPDQSVLPPQNYGAFSALSGCLRGTDERPPQLGAHPVGKDSYDNELREANNRYPWGNELSGMSMYSHLRSQSVQQQQQNLLMPVFNNINNLQNRQEEKEVQKTELEKKKQKKKNKQAQDKHKTINVKEMEGYMGELPLDKLLEEIEGNQVTEKKSKKASKKSGGGKSTAGAEKENKENTLVQPASVPAANTGNAHGKKAGPAAAAPAANLPNTLSNSKSMSVPLGSKSRSSDEPEEEFVSADEGGQSPPVVQLPFFPPMPTSSVLLDEANYVADDDDIMSKIRQSEQFITVAGKSKKSKDSREKEKVERRGSGWKNNNQHHAQQQLHNSPQHSASPVQKRKEVEKERETSTPTHGPVLADFIPPATDKKETGWICKKGSNKRPEQLTEADFPRAASANGGDEMLGGSDAPATPKFSYADAAKRRSEQNSREVSPQMGNKADKPKEADKPPTPPPPPPPAEASPAVESESDVVVDEPASSIDSVSSQSQQMIYDDPAIVGVTTQAPERNLGLSFFYDENETGEGNGDGSMMLMLGDNKMFKFSAAQPTPHLDPRTAAMVETLAQHWRDFQQGPAPVRFVPMQQQ